MTKIRDFENFKKNLKYDKNGFVKFGKKPNVNVYDADDEDTEGYAKHIVINNVEEFADYINEEYPNITSMFLEIIATIEDENPFLSSDEVGEQTCLTFYEDFIFPEWKDGHIDLYIDEDEILDYLYTIWE